MAVTVVGRTNPAAYIQDYINQYIQQRDQKNAMEEQRKQQVMALIAKNPQMAEQLRNANPEAFAGVNVPSYQPSAEEQLRDKAARQGLQDFDTLPTSARQQGTYRMGYGADMAHDTVKMTNANDVYSNPSSFAPQMQTRQRIDDKMLLNAEQGQKAKEWGEEFSRIKLPESGAKVAETKATTGLRIAETGKVGAETNNLRAQGQAAAQTGGVVSGNLESVPPQFRDLVKKIANYEVDPSKAISQRSGHREMIMQMVSAFDPTYDQSQYGSRSALRQDFTSGKGANTAKSINTIVRHLAQLNAASNKLDNGSFTPYNAVANAASGLTGSPEPTAYNTAKQAVINELATVFKNTGATDQEIKAWSDSFSAASSKKQQKQAIHAAIELMSGRMAALGEQWQAGMGKPSDFRILTDDSKAILKQLGADPSIIDRGNITAGGAVSQQQAPASYKQTATGPNGHKIGTNDGGQTWFDVQSGERVQ